MELKLPRKLAWLFAPDHGALRHRGAYGGRGSGKSFNYARMAALRGYQAKRRILATREIQASIRESFHAELRAAIESVPFLDAFYDVQKTGIYGRNGTEFIFHGLRHNIASVKSLAHIDVCIVEEAQDVPEESWRKLTPTIRAKRSEIWTIWNPTNEDDPVDQRLLKNTPPRSRVIDVNYMDNPFFPAELEEERQHDAQWMHPNIYAHIWEGAYLVRSEAQVLADKCRVAEFTPLDSWNGPYDGLDFGFSQDPTAGVRCWIADNRLYIEREAAGVRWELDNTAENLKDGMPGIERHEIIADCARPESISYLRRNGLPRIKACKKWKGSVEDGISFLRSFDEIVIHERCTGVRREARLYSYKVDRLSGQVLDSIIDANNHFWDAVRYALDPVIRRNRTAVGRIGSV